MASSFRGFLYEEYCHSLFAKGKNLPRRKITEAVFDEEIVIEKSNLRFSSLAEISQNRLGYHIPVSRCLESIDSVLHQKLDDGQGLQSYIFQIKNSESGHPINSSDLLKYLKAAGIYKSVEKHPQSISINFVIPYSLNKFFNSLQTFEGINLPVPHDVKE